MKNFSQRKTQVRFLFFFCWLLVVDFKNKKVSTNKYFLFVFWYSYLVKQTKKNRNTNICDFDKRNNVRVDVKIDDDNEDEQKYVIKYVFVTADWEKVIL